MSEQANKGAAGIVRELALDLLAELETEYQRAGDTATALRFPRYRFSIGFDNGRTFDRMRNDERQRQYAIRETLRATIRQVRSAGLGETR